MIIPFFAVFFTGLQTVSGRRNNIDVLNGLMRGRNNDMCLDDLTAVNVEFSFRNRYDNTAAKVFRDRSHEIAGLLHLIGDQIIRKRELAALITCSSLGQAVTGLQFICNILDRFYAVFLQSIIVVPSESINVCIVDG